MKPPWTIAPVLGVHDLRAAVDYYCDTLGFTRPLMLHGPPKEPVYALISRDGASIHLQIRRRTVFVGAREDHECDAYLFVNDSDALYAEWCAKGVTIHRAIQDEPYGLRDFTIATPDGHRLTVGMELRQ
jgi:uncharacterized glyoxalase superfamily protein PhnB